MCTFDMNSDNSTSDTVAERSRRAALIEVAKMASNDRSVSMAPCGSDYSELQKILQQMSITMEAMRREIKEKDETIKAMMEKIERMSTDKQLSEAAKQRDYDRKKARENRKMKVSTNVDSSPERQRSPILTNNRFNVLSDDCEDDGVTEVIGNPVVPKQFPSEPRGNDGIVNSRTSSVCMDSSSSEEGEEEEVVENEKHRELPTKKEHSPAFYVQGISLPKLEKVVAKKQMEGVKARILPSGKTAITCERKDRELMTTWLKKHCTGGETKTCNDERKGVSVVKGIHFDYDEAQVIEQLEELVDFKIISVKRFQNERKKEDPKLHWWIVTTDNKSQAMTLKKRATFFGTLRTPIFWEPYRSDIPTRCFNCNQLQHIAKNCMYPTRCGRCAGKHPSNECHLEKPAATIKDYSKYACIPCKGAKGHPSGSFNCPIIMKQMKENKERQAATKEPAKLRMQPPRAEDFNIPKKMQRGAPAVAVPKNLPSWTYSKGPSVAINQEARQLFGMESTNVMSKCMEFWDSYGKISDVAEKKLAYIKFMMEMAK